MTTGRPAIEAMGILPRFAGPGIFDAWVVMLASEAGSSP